MTEDFETYARVKLESIEEKVSDVGAVVEKLSERQTLHAVEIARLKTVQNIWTGLIAAAVSGMVAVMAKVLT